jgi:hypothetical protein
VLLPAQEWTRRAVQALKKTLSLPTSRLAKRAGGARKRRRGAR